MSAEERRPLVETAPKQSTATTTSLSSLQPAVEIPPASALTEPEAARLTTKIQLRLGMIADSIDAVLPMIEEAKNGNAHQALGYSSWTAYVADKFGGVLARLTKSERLPFVELLAGQGMSTRAIASVVGVSKDTVSRDLRAGVSDETPAEPIAAVGSAGFFTDEAEMRDAFAMADATPDEFETALTEARADDDLSRENVVSNVTAIKKIAGTDGKSYARTKPSKPRRRPLPGAYRDHGRTVRRSVESLSWLHHDDRFPSNREAVRRSAADDLVYAANELLDLLDDLGVDRHQHRTVQ